MGLSHSPHDFLRYCKWTTSYNKCTTSAGYLTLYKRRQRFGAETITWSHTQWKEPTGRMWGVFHPLTSLIDRLIHSPFVYLISSLHRSPWMTCAGRAWRDQTNPYREFWPGRTFPTSPCSKNVSCMQYLHIVNSRTTQYIDDDDEPHKNIIYLFSVT